MITFLFGPTGMVFILGVLGVVAAALIGFGSFLLSLRGKKGSMVFNVMVLLLAGNSVLNILTALGG